MELTMNMNSSTCDRIAAPCSPLHAPRAAFTLVELLVVITIIGILAALITVAAVGALKTAQQTRIKVEINQIAMAIRRVQEQVPRRIRRIARRTTTPATTATRSDEAQVSDRSEAAH